MNVFELFAKITLDTSEYDKKLKNVTNEAQNLGKKISNFGNSISNVGNKLTKFITTPALAAGSAVAGIFLVKGWNRLVQIDEAKAKLRGLGHDAESVKDIMDSALKSVKGTAYGMDEAATTAASAVAAGVKQGKQLTDYLTTVGDAAAIAGTSMGDMGAIFNKVVTAGKAQNDVLRQLADRGIPIYQWLAEETHHSAEEVSELARKGEIDTETFLNAVKHNVGGAAQELGNATITGAMDNIWAAVSRVGANFLGAADDADSFAGKLLPLLIKVQDKLGVLEEKAKEWGKIFGEVFGAFIEWLETGEVDLSKMGDEAQSIWKTIEPTLNMLKDILTTIGDIWSSLTDEQKATVVQVMALSTVLGPLLSLIGGGISTIGGMVTAVGNLKNGFDLLKGAIKGTAEAAPAIEKLGETLASAGSAATGTSTTVGGATTSLAELAVESGAAGAALEAGVISGVVALGVAGNKLDETLRGGNGVLTEFGAALHDMQMELSEAGNITNEQADSLYKLIEEMETSGASANEMVTAFVNTLNDMGVSSENAQIAINNLNGQNLLTADTYNLLNSEVQNLSSNQDISANKTLKTITSFDELKDAVSKTGMEMNLTDYQLGSLMESMSKGDGSAEALKKAYENLIDTTKVCGIDTKEFSDVLGVTVPGATQKTNDALNSTSENTKSFGEIVKETFTNLTSSSGTWGIDLMNNFAEGINSAKRNVLDAIQNVTSAIRDLIGFSEPSKGPLSDFHTYAPDMMKLFAKGIKDNEKLITDQISDSFNFESMIKDQDIGINANVQSTGIGSVSQDNHSDAKRIISLLEELVNNGIHNDIELKGDAEDIFSVVRRKNYEFTQATGYSGI